MHHHTVIVENEVASFNAVIHHRDLSKIKEVEKRLRVQMFWHLMDLGVPEEEARKVTKCGCGGAGS